MNAPVQEEPLPVYSIPKIIHARDRMADTLVSRYAEIAISSYDDLNLFLDDLMHYAPGCASREVLFETFRPFLGAPYSAAWWRDFFWHIAANEDLLRAGIPLKPWRAPGVREWVPVQVMRVDPAPARNRDSRYALTIRVLAGQACPVLFQKIVSGDWLKRLSRYVGFTSMRHGRPFLSPYQYTSLRMFVLLDPEFSREGRPGFQEMRCKGVHLKHNELMLNRRFRRKGDFVCPHSFIHDCHHCAVGFLECPVGTHMSNYIEKPCLGCGEQAWFDPDIQTTLCVSCWRKQVAKGT